MYKAALPDLCAATFPSGKARSPCATSPKALPLSHLSIIKIPHFFHTFMASWAILS